MSSFSVVLDACVLVSAPVRDTLLRAADQGLYRPHWSEDILAEVRRVLVRESMTSDSQATYLVETLREVFPEAMVEGYESLIPAMTNNENDRHVVAAAVSAGAQAIVTHNIRHFPDDALSSYDIEVLTPDEYLLDLHDLHPRTMRRIVHEQGEDLNPPKSAAQICSTLSAHTPVFAARILQEISD
jgi:predicted nucleic acid-binding protein